MNRAAPARLPGAAAEAAGRWHRLTAAPSLPLWIAAIAGVAITGAVAWVAGPHYDAVLQPTDREIDDPLRSQVGDDADLDIAGLRSYAAFRGVEPWSTIDRDGSPCLLIIDRSTDLILDVACAPAGAGAFVEAAAWPTLDRAFADGLPDGTVIRFLLGDETVDVSVIRAP
ncbi:hypothetical protein JOD63_000135 [Microbacterium terrae]|uniref:Uncharacterized protein n=1 Tax=Microbacterium terrae TaxID=69369 RepID=A0A0M2H372_9MICO|nr:hypothetical protein [Microbacterium terrae]KJL38748.1 hypothetical protein RS81_02543 [Microbacterium terrae]MBP1076167.1 hypothetical protein [Microbacterium terrae]GLJ96987.1 hypothetical protein GCM10017594_01840 [Microbacterium terrae]